MMSKIVIFVIWFAVKTVFVSSQSCDYVNDLDLRFKDTETSSETWDNIKVTGCMSDNTFAPRKVTFIFAPCEQSVLLKLERGFISNMKDLNQIKIGKCYVETIEPGAFSNLPKLEKIEISFNTFKTVPKGVFNILPSLQIIYLLDGKLNHIEDDAFSNLTNLRGFSVDRCRLEEMRREWLTNTTNLVAFSVYRNSIRKIPAGMFHGWKKLKFLNLNSNAISVIEGVLFKDNSPHIRNLDLHHNRLTKLNPEMLPELTFIEHFSVSANLLNYIPEELLKKVRAGHMVIFSNPFTCPCLENVNKILLEKDVIVDGKNFEYVKACKDRDVPVCGYSSNFSTTCVEAVDEKLTKNIISQMKKVGYDTVYDPFGQQCAMFDV